MANSTKSGGDNKPTSPPATAKPVAMSPASPTPALTTSAAAPVKADPKASAMPRIATFSEDAEHVQHLSQSTLAKPDPKPTAEPRRIMESEERPPRRK